VLVRSVLNLNRQRLSGSSQNGAAVAIGAAAGPAYDSEESPSTALRRFVAVMKVLLGVPDHGQPAHEPTD
jgi:hypothetical protein